MRAVICGYYGRGNGGDEALLMSLLQMLPPQVTPIVLSGNPKQTSNRYQVESYHSRSPQDILRALKGAQVFIWGGGSLMQDVTSLASPFYYAGLMALSQQLGLSTIAWAQGIGPLNNPLTRQITQQVLKNCSGISVRDAGSAELLANWEISSLTAPDPVWSLQSNPVQNLSNLKAPRVAVNLRPHQDLTPERLTQIAGALNSFTKASETSLLLVPFQASQDLIIAQSLANQLTVPYQIIQLDDPSLLKGLFRGVEMVIGMRYHSLIMAAAEGSRCFALSYDPKVDQLMQQANIPGWKLPEMPQSSQEISTVWLQHYANQEALSIVQRQSFLDRSLLHRELLLKICQ